MSLRLELAHAYAAARGATARRDTLDGLEDVVRWLRRVESREGPTFHRSMPQAFRGIGWATSGHVRDDRQRHRNRLANWLDMLIDLGVVESWRPIYAGNREGLGILVALRRDSSVGRAIRRRCDSSSPRLSPPLREKSPSNVPIGDVRGGKIQQARAVRAREGRRGGHRVTARAIEALERASEETGHELVCRYPWLGTLQPAVLLRAATYAFAPRQSSGWAKHWTPRLSERSRLRAEAAYEQLERLDGRGAGAAAIIDLAAGEWRRHVPAGRAPRFVEPRTPGVLVKGLRQRAKLARRAAELGNVRAELAAAAEGWPC